ncbi:PaaI family thioesterase [Flexibacterium corallicola]|uniref:PaaI family thioesterase n=1 Tax=Flexibacterium corallicola TaxID=3037259 RepID=UPI00286EF0E8|nr:PaaI family thioesterase [Pseudovibrio sp. M1P-2-3]
MNLKVRLGAQELTAFLDQVFPQMHSGGRVFFIEDVGPGEAKVRLEAGENELRPGGTVSGPSLMTLADFAAYTVILSNIGPQALAVTTNLNINFLRKAEKGAVFAAARILKLGKRLVVIDCEIWQGARENLVGHATATYSIPPQSQ